MEQATPPASMIDGIYDAAMDSSLWPEAVAEISAALNGLPVALLVNDVRSGLTPLFAAAKVERWSIERYKQDYSTLDRNPALSLAMSTEVGKAMNFDDLLGDRYRNSAFYNDILKPQGVTCYLNSVALRTGHLFAGLCLLTSPGYRPASNSEIARFEAVTRHLGRAFKLSGHLDGISQRQKSLEATLDCLTSGVFLTDRMGRVSWRNKAAEEFLEREDGLKLTAGRLAAASPSDDRALRSALFRGADATIPVARPSGNPGFVLCLHRLWHGLSLAGETIAVFVRDPDQNSIPAPSLISAFGLTEAEAKLAAALVAGRSLADYARENGRSRNTLRSQLAAVFSKTGTGRQAELVALVVSKLSVNAG